MKTAFAIIGILSSLAILHYKITGWYWDYKEWKLKRKNKMRTKIFTEIENERTYQDNKWGVESDNKNTINDWVAYITTYCGQAAKYGATEDEQRKQLLKAVAIGVAALERFDVNGKFPKRHYDK